MHRAAVWQHSSNWNIKIVHNSIEYFLWNSSDFTTDAALSCLRIFFTNWVFQLPPSENTQVGWDLANRMTSGCRFDAKWICPMESYTWGIQVFCSRNEAPPEHFLREERAASEEKSDEFHKKCSIELWAILMFELLLCCHTAAPCVERTYY